MKNELDRLGPVSLLVFHFSQTLGMAFLREVVGQGWLFGKPQIRAPQIRALGTKRIIHRALSLNIVWSTLAAK